MSLIDQIIARLSAYPTARFTESPTSIEVLPEDSSGFSVGLEEKDGRVLVWFGGWHEHFDTESEALDCFAFGLSDSCRLTVEYRGSTPTRWTVESVHDGKWVPDSSVGLLLVPFWRSKRVSHLQNRLIPRSGSG